MKHLNRPLLILAGVALAGMAFAEDEGAAVSDAQTKDRPFHIEFSAGAEYDSTVAVLELDTSSGQSDTAAVLDFGLGYDRALTQRLKLKLSYDFSQTLHDQFDTFDVRIHRGTAELTRDFGRIDAGALFVYADAALDDEGFLLLKRTDLFVSRLFGKRLFLRLAGTRTDKEFAGAPGRDATADAWSGDAFVFLNGVSRYFVVGYQSADEDADDDQFDYDGARSKLQFSNRFARGSRYNTLKLEVRQESRDYRTDLLPLAEPRRDDRYGFLANLEVPLSDHTRLDIRYQYNDNGSNLASVDFDEHVASLKFAVKY